MSIGAFFGAALAGKLANKFGRRQTLLFSAYLSALGSAIVTIYTERASIHTDFFRGKVHWRTDDWDWYDDSSSVCD